MRDPRSISAVFPNSDEPSRRISRVMRWVLLAWAGAAAAASSVPTDSLFFDAFEGALQTIDVACGSGVVAGDTVSCIATGTFASSAQIDISADVDWSSSDATIASVVDAGGHLLAVNQGQSTITATRGTVQGTTLLNVVATLLVQSTQPADSATDVAAPQDLVITFNGAVNPATLTAQTISGPCSGSVRMSSNGFTSCLAFATASASLSGGNTVATFTPAPAWSFGTAYQIKVTTAAQSSGGSPLGSEYVTANGFTTGTDTLCAVDVGGVVISQIYGAGGNPGATYAADFIELHNRGRTTADLTGWSVQYASQTGSSWQVTPLSGSIPAGGYFLVKESSGGATGSPLPTPDGTGAIAMAAAAGKVALVNATTALTGACPSGAQIVDFVGYGATANCFEGAGPAPAPSVTTADIRKFSGCFDTNANATDLQALAVAPRNLATPAFVCTSCSANETGQPAEADYCDVEFPLNLSVQSGTSTGNIYARIFEQGVTGMGFASPNVIAQIGYGPMTLNPENQDGWVWSNAMYNAACSGCGSNDEYQAALIAPQAPGTYFYGSRFSFDGTNWTYCDGDVGDSGAGSNAGLTFQIDNLPAMTVTP
jgi:Lamin Tail Domain/Bacterial Ig-like domain